MQRALRVQVVAWVLGGAFLWGQGKTWKVPAEVGRGLKPMDSLQAVLRFLEAHKGYEADSMRFWCFLRLVDAASFLKRDTLRALVRKMEEQAAQSSYPLAQAAVHLAWGSVFWEEGRCDSVMVRGEAAARLAEAHQSPLYLAWAYHLIALTHGRQGNTKEQLAYYQKALPLWQRGGDSLGLSSSLYNLGNLYYDQDQYDEAEKYYRRALQLRQPLPYDERTAYACEGLGLVAHARQNYQEALQYYQKAITLLERAGAPASLGKVYQKMARLFWDQKEYGEALRYYQRALEALEQGGDRLGVAQVYNSIAFLYYLRGDYGQAIESAQKARAICEQLGAQEELIRC